MAINIADELNAATTKGKVASAKQVFLSDNTTNVEDKLSTLEASIGSGGSSTDLTELKTKVAALETAVDDKLDSDQLGVANGAASLDTNGTLTTDQLPADRTDDVLEFAGIEAGTITVNQSSASSYDSIIFSSKLGAFVASAGTFTPTYYANWANARFYGTGAPRVPLEGKLYVDTTTNTLYRWDGSAMVSVSGSSSGSGMTDEEKAEFEALKTDVEDLMNAQYPMTIGLQANPTKVGDYTVTWSVQRKGTALTPDSLKLTKQVNNGTATTLSSDAKASGSVTTSVTGNKEVIALTVTKSGLGTKTSSVTKYVCYYGANAATAISETIINALTTVITTNASFNPTITTTSGQYMWLVVPSFLAVNKVTSSGFDVPFEAATTITTSLGTFKAYRTTNALTAATWKLIIT